MALDVVSCCSQNLTEVCNYDIKYVHYKLYKNKVEKNGLFLYLRPHLCAPLWSN